jgi:adenine-specific DNA-methyltransferase
MAKVTSKLTSLPSPREQVETRFVELMTELFQLDEAEALDFGLYRVIRRHNQEVKDFLGKIITENGSKTLQGGQLVELLDAAFAVMGHDAQAEDKLRIKDLEDQLGLRPGMTQAQREDKLTQAENIPAIKGLVAEYRSRTETLAQQRTVQQDRAEVLNRLYQFFSRHYQDGDFIVERRYGKGGSRYVKSTGEDTEFHWATEDMYYIKSGDIFTDFPVTLANGQRILFTVEPEGLKDTRAALKPNDKAHYELDETTKDGEVIKVRLKYLKGAQTEKHKDEIVIAVLTAAQKADAGGTAEVASDIRRWLNRFIARNQRDFFIHKRLKDALTEDLDIFIKTEVLDIDQLLAGATQQTDLPKRAMKVARLVREIGGQIINFLAALEDFQKALWEKKKLVLETRYVVTLDRLERYCPEWLAKNIDTIVKKQRKEWKELGLGDYANASACVRKTEGDRATAETEHYLPLPIDTKNFDAEFKWSMLEAVTAVVDLDDALDGLAIQSDNWQALNVFQEKYRQRIQSVYADPPYNTDAGPISYKNGYRKASWAAFIQNRLGMVRNYLTDDGIACITIDDCQKNELIEIISKEFGSNNLFGTVVIKNSPSGRPSVKGFRVNHEYALFCGVTPQSDIGMLERSAAQFAHFGNTDDDGPFAWENFRKRGGATTHRSARPKQFYPIYVEGDKLRIPKLEWQKDQKSWKVLEEPRVGELTLFPVNDDGTERVWSWGHVTALQNIKDLEVRRSTEGVVSIFRKVRPRNEGSLPSTVWVKPEYSAVEYGSVLLKNMFNKREFSFPKSVHAVADCLSVAGAHKNAIVLDIFAGSGTTPHAVINLNQSDDGERKFVVFETNDYIYSFTIPRIIKAATASEWVDGQAKNMDGPGLFMKVQALEQYEDTLESLDTDIGRGESGELPFQDAAFALRYRLDKTSRALYCGVDRFDTPFGYQLKRAEGSGEARAHDVDLVESIPYLLGLDVIRLYREDQGVVLVGRNRRKQLVSVFFRDCNAKNSAEWVKTKLAEHPADRVYTNDPASLSFEGCDQFEAIEAIFALQFGRL